MATVVVERSRVRKSARVLTGVRVFTGTSRVCTRRPTPLLPVFLRAAVHIAVLPRTAGSLSICNTQSGESHWAEHLTGDLIEECRELHFFLH